MAGGLQKRNTILLIFIHSIDKSMRDIVELNGGNMAKFSRRFCIPYRTLQAWCDGTNECPVYIKLMICEIMGLYSRAIYIEPDARINF